MNQDTDFLMMLLVKSTPYGKLIYLPLLFKIIYSILLIRTMNFYPSLISVFNSCKMLTNRAYFVLVV